MSRARFVLVQALVLSAGLWAPSAARAQVLPSRPIEIANGTITVGVDVTATLGAKDDEDSPHAAFFNYTDYEHNALRLFRLSITGMWRPSARLAFLTELRSEDRERFRPYALYVRLRPWKDRPFDLQAGLIPTVFGAFARRSYGSDNPLIGYPLAYQYLTSLRPDAIPGSADDLLLMRGRGWLARYPVGNQAAAAGVPLISAYRWDTGVEAHLGTEHYELAGALTRGTLANPRVKDDNDGLQWSGRGAWKPAPAFTLGASVSRGEFLTRQISDTYAPWLGKRPYTQQAVGLDAEYSRDYFLVRGEAIRSQWTLPALGLPLLSSPLVARSAFLESRYRFTPRFFAAARLDGLTFSKIRGDRYFGGRPTTWDAPVSRVEGGGGVYLQRNLTVRAVVQRNWRDGGRVRRRTFVSAQIAYWF
jgi:hypothetical protein